MKERQNSAFLGGSERAMPRGCPDDTCGGQRRNGGPCGKSAGWGTDHKGVGKCRLHGGMAPSGRMAGKRALQRKAMEEAMVTYGLPADGNPDELLLAEVRAAAGQVHWVRSIIREMEPEELVWGPQQSSHQVGQSVEGPVDVTTSVEGARLNMWVELELKKAAHLVKACDIAIRAGIQERLVRLAEQDGERQSRWLQACLGPLNLTAAQVRAAMDSGLRHLYLLDGTG